MAKNEEQIKAFDPLALAIAEIIIGRIESRLLPASQPRRLLTVAQAGEYLGRTADSIRHLVSSGRLPVVRLDSRVFLDRVDLDRLIEDVKQIAA
jgi:excisionase family DNA binding protein